MKNNVLFRIPILITAILSSLFMVLYTCVKFPASAAIILPLWLFGWLVAVRTQLQHRKSGILLLIIDVIYSLIFWYMLVHIFIDYQQMYSNLSYNNRQYIDYIATQLYKSTPNILLNILFLAGLIYCVLLLIIRVIFIELVNSNTINHLFLERIYKIAYTKIQDTWFLLPHFLSIRPFSYLFVFNAMIIFLWYYWQNSQPNQVIDWVLWLMPLLIFLAIDWWFWLSGKTLQPDTPPDFLGEHDGFAFSEQSFEDLWRKYHKFWSNKWLVAGNKTTGGKE